MHSPRMAMLLTGCLAAVMSAAQQPLVCPPAPAGRPCEAFHYHVQMYRADTKQFTEIYGGTQFATQAACDRAREQQVAANAKVVEFFRGIKQQVEADRIGPCHCDMTGEKSGPTYLADGQRTMQLRAAEEIRLRVRERLLDRKVPSDSELIRGLYADPPSTAMLATPKLVPPPQSAPAPILTAVEELKPTTTVENTKPAVAALDLPLVDLNAPPAAPAPSAEGTAVNEAGVPVGGAATSVDAAPPLEETRVEAQPEVETAPEPASEEELASAQETAERFISYETQRIQNVLKASGAIADENVKSRIFEECMQRIQLLSNLRLLIEGSGMRSRLAAAARDAQTEADRLALVARLFGEDVKPHWAPRDAADVVFEIDPSIANAPERALRDTTGRFSADQKKRALYLVLAQTQPTEDQRLWLSTLVEGFLR